MIVVFPIL